MSDLETAVVSTRGAARIGAGHPWVFRPDVVRGPKHDATDGGPALVRVRIRAATRCELSLERALRYVYRDVFLSNPLWLMWRGSRWKK